MPVLTKNLLLEVPFSGLQILVHCWLSRKFQIIKVLYIYKKKCMWILESNTVGLLGTEFFHITVSFATQ